MTNISSKLRDAQGTDVHRAPPPSQVAPHSISKVFRNALSSTMGAAVVATVVTPLDVVKIRLQAHVCPVAGSNPCPDPKHVDGSFDAARKIIRAEGVRGLWRGLNVTLLLAIPTTGIYFTLYEALRDQLKASNEKLSESAIALLAGATARVATATAASPLEMARTSLQAGVDGPNATVSSVLRQVQRNEGVFALWRGLGPTLLRDAPFSAIYWSAYEGLKDPSRSILPRHIFQPGNEFAVYLSAGIGAGSLAAICTGPADVIKTRRQSWNPKIQPPTAASPTASQTASSSFGIAREIVNAEGVRGLFRGTGPRVAKVAPACAIMMSTFETFRSMLGGTKSNSSTS